MRRFCLCLTLILCLLSACGGEKVPDVYETTYLGSTYTIDRQAGTITHEQQVYRYEEEGGTTKIIYPNGAVYRMTRNGMYSSSGWNDAYEQAHDIPGETLVAVLSNQADASPRPRLDPVSILLGVIGLCAVLFPRLVWWVSRGIWYRDAEPSAWALPLIRLEGGALVLIAILLLRR